MTTMVRARKNTNCAGTHHFMSQSGLSMSKLDARCQSCAWDHLCVLSIQLQELSLVLGCIFVIMLVRATNRASDLSWASACALVCDRSRLIERPAQCK